MAEISIPGVSNKYGTNETINKLMEAERIPLNREKATLEKYQSQQNSWRLVNRLMSSLRESARTLYSFDNPFNSKLATSSNEDAITATPGRDAAIETFNINVEEIATADRFLSAPIDKDHEVPQGTYTFTVSEKSVSFKWKGGKVQDFVNALNRRGGETVKASLIGVSSSQKALLIESLKTGKENQLVFGDDALEFVRDIRMIEVDETKQKSFGEKSSEYKKTAGLSYNAVKLDGNTVTVPPKSGYELAIPAATAKTETNEITFSATLVAPEPPEEEADGGNAADGTGAAAYEYSEPVMPDTGMMQFKGVIIYNDAPEYSLGALAESPLEPVVEPIAPTVDNSVAFIKTADGLIPLADMVSDNEEQTFTIRLSDYPGATAIVIKNNNSEKTLTVSTPTVKDTASIADGYHPVNAISRAGDAKVKYEGITMYRDTNTIDDIVPNVTLNLYEPTGKQARISIKPDVESSKDALINLVGNYNRVMAEINILTQNKNEIITELEYFTEDETAAAEERLGMFMGDSTLTGSKNTLQRITSSHYPLEENTVTMLSQIGISTSASGGGGSFSASRLRGYLEIDEKKLDEMLESNIDDIRRLFGFDSDGDLIVDSGIAYEMERNLQAYVQTGGILANKISGLDRQISSTNTRIERLEDQIAKKEAEYRRQYGAMESTLNSLQSQSDSISNFTQQQNNSRR